MQVKTSLNLNFHLREEVKLLYGEYGAENLSAFVNGFFYYLLRSENPPNGIDIEKCMRDALNGTIVKSRNKQHIEDARKEQLVHEYLETSWGQALLEHIRKFGMKRIISRGNLRKFSEEIYSSYGEIILEDDLLRYLTDWYNAAKQRPDFKDVELAVFLAGGVRVSKQEHENTEESEVES